MGMMNAIEFQKMFDKIPEVTVLFPKLFKKSSTGADQEWAISTEDNVIITRWGQVGGSIQETRDVVKEGKNVGKKNETSAAEQAQLEAEATHTKKLKKGYVTTLKAARAGKVSDLITGGVNPMLAHKFSEQAKKINFPAFVQPKFDGHRCIVVVEDGQATMWTRTRKPITGLPHIIAAVQKLVQAGTFSENMVLDGELYNHDYRERFEELSSFIRTPEPKEGHEAVQYHIYDLADENEDQQERFRQLATVFEKNKSPALVQVETRTVASKDELEEAFAEFLEQGYEGLMVRNAAAKYVGKRSYDLQKVKEFEDAEFVVHGVTEGRGKLAGKAIFQCRTPDPVTDSRMAPGAPFDVKMKGKLEDLKKFFENPKLALGKPLTVRFQGVTKKERVPRFGVGIRFAESL